MTRLAIIGTLDEVARDARIVPRIVGARLAAAVDRDSGAAQGRIHNVEILADNFASLLANHMDDFDAIVIHGDLQDHLKQCRRAAQAGKHLLLLNLFALSASDVAAIDASCASAGVRLMAGGSLRFLPETRAIQKSLAGGQLGEPGLLRMHYWEPAVVQGDGLRSQPPGRFSADGLSDWLTAAIDLAISMFDQVPAHVFSTARTWPVSAPAEHEYRQVHLGFSGVGMALVDHARTLPNHESYFSMSLIGSKGAAYADDLHNMQLLYRGGPPMALRAGQDEMQGLGMLQEFVAAIQENRAPLPGGADAIRAVQVSESVAESLATGRAIQHDGGPNCAAPTRNRETATI